MTLILPWNESLHQTRHATVIGVDAAPRLLEVVRMRAQTFGVDLDPREGDLLALPVDDASVDVVLSVFGVIFAADPTRALREIARVLRPGGRVLVSAWIPADPMDAMLGAMGRIMRRVTNAQPMEHFAWSDATTVGRVAAEAGLALEATTPGELAIRATSPEAYVKAGQEHPMAPTARHALQDPDVEKTRYNNPRQRSCARQTRMPPPSSSTARLSFMSCAISPKRKPPRP